MFTKLVIISCCYIGVLQDGNESNGSETEVQITAAVVDLNDESDSDYKMIHDDEEEDSFEINESDGPLGKKLFLWTFIIQMT
mgnify:CR=1 FL=1